MEIYINGNKADITLENEKTIGDIISGMEQWIASSGHRLSGISVNGNKIIDSSQMEQTFAMDIGDIKKLEIITSSVADLTAESLLTILDDINNFQTLNHEDKNKFTENWKTSPQAIFTQRDMPDLFGILINSFSGTGLNLNSVFSIAEERLREVKEPREELEKLQPLLNETCARLKDISLDVQTGKDARASQTIQLFSGVTEKILRITGQLELQGFLNHTGNQDKTHAIINDLSQLIKELLDAYERHDTVLVGDLAEYEASVKLQELYGALAETGAFKEQKGEK